MWCGQINQMENAYLTTIVFCFCFCAFIGFQTDFVLAFGGMAHTPAFQAMAESFAPSSDRLFIAGTDAACRGATYLFASLEGKKVILWFISLICPHDFVSIEVLYCWQSSLIGSPLATSTLTTCGHNSYTATQVQKNTSVHHDIYYLRTWNQNFEFLFGCKCWGHTHSLCEHFS